MDGRRDFQEPTLHKNSQVGDEIAAWDEVASVGVGVGMTGRGDGDWDQAGSEARGPEGFHDGGSYSTGIDDQGFERARGLNQVAYPADDFKIVSPEGEGFDVAEYETEMGLQFKGDGMPAAGGLMASFEDGEGGGVLATAEVETEEDVEIEKRHWLVVPERAPTVDGIVKIVKRLLQEFVGEDLSAGG